MRSPQTKTINGVTYTVHQLAPTQALDVFMDLVRMAGPALAPIVSNLGELRKLAERDVENLSVPFVEQAIKAFVSGIDKKTTHEILQKLATVTVCQTADGTFKLVDKYEIHFAEHGLAQVFKWAAFALSAQYDDFWSAFKDSISSVTLPSPKA